MELIFHTSEARRKHAEREQDLAFRALERMWRRIDDTRRLVDKKAQALVAVANLAALVGGFEMVVLIETQFAIPSSNPVALAFFALFSSVAIGAMVIAVATALLLLVRILHFDAVRSVTFDAKLTFARYWQLRCMDEWWLCLLSFFVGLPFFLASLAVMSWLRFGPTMAAPIIVTCVSVISLGVLVRLCGRFRGAPGFRPPRRGEALDGDDATPELRVMADEARRSSADAEGSRAAAVATDEAGWAGPAPLV